MTRRTGRSATRGAAAAQDRPRRPSGAAGRASGPPTGLRPAHVYTVPAVSGLLLLAVIVVFAQTAGHEFVNCDDPEYVSENPHVRRGLTGEATVWALTAFHSCNWHPLTWLSHMLDCRLYDLQPGGHHVSNLLLHAAAAVILFLALRRMTTALWPSAFAAGLFAIHPLRVESVAWVAERKDVLSGLMFMATLWFYARYAQRPASWGRYLWVVTSFALGLAAKPMLVTLPLVLLLLDYWPLGRIGWARTVYPWSGSGERGAGSSGEANQASTTSLVRLIVEKVPLFLFAAASCAVTLAAQRRALRSFEELTFAGRVANGVVAYVAYLGKMLYPAGLAVVYPLAKHALPAWKVAAAVALLAFISTAAFAARRKCPYLLFGWLWYLGTLAPVIGLVQVGPQAMADRYTYLTQIGLYVALAWGAADAAHRWLQHRWPLAGLAALVLAGLMVCAWRQTVYWRDSETLWTRTLECTSQNSAAHFGLGSALAARGEAARAIAEYQAALDITPNYADPHVNLGAALARLGRIDEALAHYRKALKIEPASAMAENNLALALADRGEVDEAIAHFREALKIQPGHAEAHNNLGAVLVRRGQIDEAIDHYRRALDIQPDYAEAHVNLGAALASLGQIDEAVVHCRTALGLAEARNDRALAETIRATIRSLQMPKTGRGAP